MQELEALERLASADSLRIGLISDTHIPEAMPKLWPQVFEAFRGVDCILHAGDIHDLSVIDELSEVAPTYVARGNGDDGSGGRPVQPEDPRLREGWLLELAGLLVGIAHTVPVPAEGGWTLERAMQRYCGRTDLDVMIFGDTHSEWLEYVDGVLCVNPGSPTLPRNLATRLGTIGFLEIADRTPRASIWQLTEHGIVAFDWARWRRPV
ncbi:MAG: YfcE family phosphodiesterase [Chloroflexi bacterium]|nr:YfcE family phosphodiesterase [Chloroflexota bacterium]